MWGRNLFKWNKDFEHAVAVVAKDQAVLDAYRKRPGHEKAAKWTEYMEEKYIGIDFED